MKSIEENNKVITDLFGNQEMKALSWREPFATLMLHGKIETRSWSTNYRGLVLICASQKEYPISKVLEISGEHQISRITKIMYNYGTDYDVNENAIAVGRLIDCRPMQPNESDKCFVKYNPALWCHIYKDVRPINPIPFKGNLKWKNLSQEFINKIQFITQTNDKNKTT